MRASAAIVAAAGADGREGSPRLVTLRSDPPLTVRPTPGGVHLVGSSAGPLGGDVLDLTVRVGAGADLTVRSAAATLAQPGPAGGRSTMAITATVDAGGSLRWLPEPLLAVRGCDHRTAVHLTLEEGATVVWRDDVVLGRHGEEPGSVQARLRVDRGGRPLVRNDLVAGPRWPGSLGPAGVGAGTRAVSTVLLVGAPARDVADGPADLGPEIRAAALRLSADAVLLTAVAPRPGALVAAVEAWLACCSRRLRPAGATRG